MAIAKNWNQSKGPLSGECLNKPGYICPMEPDSAMEKDKLRMHTTWTDLKGMMLSKKKSMPKGYILSDSIY